MTDVKKQIFAVDGDTLAYRTAAVCETHFEGACESILNSTLKEIVTETGVTDMRIYLSGKDNFRYAIAKSKPYKGNRETMARPQFLQHCRDYLVREMNAIIVDGFEADDAIATDMVVNGAIHCGVDKDIFQIAGKHYNYVKKEWREISPDEAILILYRQILMGDTSDNIPGLPKVGEKTAFNAIQSADTAEADCMKMYEDTVALKRHLLANPEVNWMEYMAEQQNLIKMRTDLILDYSRIYSLEPNTEGFVSHEGGMSGQEPASAPPRSIKL